MAGNLIPDLTVLAGPRCGNCKFAKERQDGGFLCRRHPPTVQFVPLVSVTILPYALGIKSWGPPPPELIEAVATVRGKPLFWPLINYPGMSADDTCGDHVPNIPVAH